MTNDEIRAFIENAIKENKVILFMKGIPNQPACGFSARTAGALNALGVQYAALDILPDPRIREELSGLSGWPTIPQLFVDGELVGGSDIVMEMFESGELAELLGAEPPDEPFEPEPQPEPVQRPMALENRLEQNSAPAPALVERLPPALAVVASLALVALLLLRGERLPALPGHQHQRPEALDVLGCATGAPTAPAPSSAG